MIEPGIHRGVTMADYICPPPALIPGVSVSATDLHRIERRCPAYAWARHYTNPQRVDDDDTKATAFGTAAHTLILEGGDVFDRRYIVKPPDFDGRTREGREWTAANATREAVGAAEFRAICAMAQAVLDHPVACTAFLNGEAEATAIARDEETGLWLRCRPDYLRLGDGVALNYKTTIDASRDAWERQAWALGYAMSAALTIDILATLGHAVNYAFVVQEKDPPHLVAVRVFDDGAIEWGRLQYRRALTLFAGCLRAGEWPGYALDVETVSLPAWAERQLERRHEHGDFNPELIGA